MVVPIGRRPMLKVVNFEELVGKEEPRGKLLPECKRDLQEVGGVKVDEALTGSVESWLPKSKLWVCVSQCDIVRVHVAKSKLWVCVSLCELVGVDLSVTL